MDIQVKTLSKSGYKVKCLHGDRTGCIGEVVGYTEGVYRCLTVDFGTGWVYNLPLKHVEFI